MDCEGFGMIVGWGVVRVAFEVKIACSRVAVVVYILGKRRVEGDGVIVLFDW